MHNITPLECSRIAQDLQIRKVQVESVVQLLDEGNTVPFITRYRKERTGGLNEEVIRQIESRVNFLRQLHDRKQTILKSIEAQGRLTDDLRDAIVKADTTKRLEDLYLPYKPKKRSLATAAREKGLEPLAHAVWYSDPAAYGNVEELFNSLVNPEKQLATVDDVPLGVQHILAEMAAETADVRASVRKVLWAGGTITSGKSEKVGEGQGLEYKDYFEFKEPARQIPPHRILALNRGEKEGALRVKLDWHGEQVQHLALHALSEHLLAVAGKTPPAPPPPPAPPVEQPAAETPPASETPPPADAPPADAPPTEAPIQATEPPPPEAPPAPEAAPLVQGLTPTEPTPVKLEGELLSADSAFRSPHAALLRTSLDDALDRLLLPSLEREIRSELSDEAESHAVVVFARNLRSLLLQPPLRGRRVLAIDPGFRTGCKIAALDEYGNLLEHAIIYPHGGGPRKKEKRPAPPPAQPAAHAETPPPPPQPTAEQPPAEAEPADAPIAEAQPDAAPTAESQPAAPEPQPVETPPAAPTDQPQATTEGQPAPPPAAPPPPPPPDRKAESRGMLQALVNKHHIEVLALGNGTGCRETEELIAELIGSTLPQLSYVIVNEAGASVYSVSPVGREEFPNFDATTRSAISIGRRLQDPLSELVKIDPESIGVGLYQHDMGHKELKESLEGVIESSVNQVGVDINTASVPLLRYVSGLNQLVARELVDYRKQHGPYTSREQLLQVPSVGPARFTQAAGFLKLPEAPNPFDRTWIHPESYALAERILGDLGYGTDVLGDQGRQEEFHTKLREANVEELAKKLDAGPPTVADILQSLLKPGRDPREDLPPPIFKKGILRLEDLQPGMELKGTVLNVVDFGAFVDIGLKDSGLVHISQMANRYIKSPYDVVSVNDVVSVWVLSVDKDRNRVSLSMIKPGTERKPPERRPPAPRPPQGARPPQQGPRPPRGPGGPGGPPRGPRPQGQGQSQGPPRGRSGPPRGPGGPPREGQPSDAPAEGAPTGRRPEPPRQPPPPPRKPRREPPKPKLTQAALEGKASLRTFSELSAFFAAKKPEDEKKPETPPPAEPPAAQPPAAEPPAAEQPPPAVESAAPPPESHPQGQEGGAQSS